MTRDEYYEWIQYLKSKGYSDEEIEEIVQSYLEQRNEQNE